MGLFDKLRAEFVDIIEFLDDSNNTLAHRFERYQNEIKYGAKLTVREGQAAVFINEGQIADVYGPGMYTLATENMPILSTLKGWKYGFNSPFKAEVVFVNTTRFTGFKWGTKNPIIVSDDRFGMIELRAFGGFEVQVVDPGMFVKGIVGTDGNFTTDEITDQLRSIIVTRFTDAVGESKLPVESFAANLNELSELAEGILSEEFKEYGITLPKFLVENVSMPEEIKKEIFEYSRLNKIDMNKLAQMKAAKAMEAAANNPSGTAGAGMGMGMGFAMANQMGQMFNQPQQGYQQPQQQPQQGYQQPQQQQAPAPPPMPPQVQFFVAVNGQQQGPYDMPTLQQMVQQGQLNQQTLVWKQGMPNWAAASTVPEVNQLFGAVPPPMPPPQP